MKNTNVYNSIWWDLVVPDPNNVLKREYLNPVWEILKGNISDINRSNLDNEDISQLLNWYENYKIIYSYPENKHKLSKKWKWIFEEINISKWKSDIMWLVEISIWRLLQNEFEDKGYDVRIRKTTNFDDVTSGIDYVVEFKDEQWNLSDIIWIDFTISEIWADSLYKNLKKEAHPEDYKIYYEKKYNKKLKTIPRVVISLSRDLAYSFTNNFFFDVLEKGHLLDNEDIKENFEYAIEEIQKLDIWSKKFQISNKVEQTNKKVIKILNKF